MFRTNRTDKAAAEAHAKIDERAAKAHSAVDSAASLSADAKDKAASLRSDARDRAGELRSQAHDFADVARDKTEEARAKAQDAADTLSPKIESAKETLLDDVLPKVASALATAAAGAVAAKDSAVDAGHRAPDAFAVLKGDAEVKRSGGKRWLLMLGAAAAGLAYAAYKRSSEREDPWASAGAYTPPSTGRDSSLGAKVSDIADAAKEKAAEAKDAASAKATEVKDAASAKATEVKDAASTKAAEAKESASDKVSDRKTPKAADDVEAEGDPVTEMVGEGGAVTESTVAPGDGGTPDIALPADESATGDAWTNASTWADGKGDKPKA